MNGAPGRNTRRAQRHGRTRTRSLQKGRGRPWAEQLKLFYEGLDGFQANRSRLALPGSYDTTYGEVTVEGIKALHTVFSEKMPLQSVPPERRVFCDLGCGNGKVVVGMALLEPALKVARGYEILVDRVEQAKTAVGKIKQKETQAKCHFESTSFLDPAVSLKNASWIYISNLCFNGETQDALAKKLQEECPKGCVIACSKEFSFPPEGRIQKEKRVNVPMSWSSSSEVTIYKVRD